MANRFDDLTEERGNRFDSMTVEAPAKKKQTGDLLSSSFIRALAGAAGAGPDLLGMARSARNWAQGINEPHPFPYGGSQDFLNAVEKVTGTELYRPENIGERFGGSTLEGAIGGAPFGPAGMIIGGLGGLGAELAGSLFNNNPAARGGGGLLASLVASIPMMLRGRPPVAGVAKQALGNPSEEQLYGAAFREGQARATGTPMTGFEALAQETGQLGHPGLGLQRYVEQQGGGAPIMAEFMAERAARNRAAFERQMGLIGPAVDDPTAIGPRIQKSAQGFLDSERSGGLAANDVPFGNYAARPFYEQAEARNIPLQTSERIPGGVPIKGDRTTTGPRTEEVGGYRITRLDDFPDLMKNPAIADALKHVTTDPHGGKVGMPQNSIEALDAAKRYLDARVKVAERSGDNYGLMIDSQAAEQIKDAVSRVSPEYRRALQIVENQRTNIQDPLERGLVGKLSRVETTEQAMEHLFPADPKTLTPQAAGRAVAQLSIRDITAARDATRQFLESRFNEVTQSRRGGVPQQGASDFMANIAGNVRQRENLRAVVEHLPGGQGAWNGFEKLLTIWEAQGKRLQPGSSTAFNQEIGSQLSQTPMSGALAQAAPAGLVSALTESPAFSLSHGVNRANTQMRESWEQAMKGQNTEVLAKILSSEQSVAELVRLSRLPATSPRARAIAASLAASAATHTPNDFQD